MINLIQYWSISDLGQCRAWPISGYFRLSRVFSGYLVLSRSVLVYLSLFQTFLGYLYQELSIRVQVEVVILLITDTS